MTQSSLTSVSIAPEPAFQERVIYAACPLCGSDDIGCARTTDCSQYPSWRPPLSPTMTWMRCGACQHSFTDGYFTDQALAVLFAHTHAAQDPGVDVEKARMLAAPIVDRVSAFVPTGTWLDVGFGNGALLHTAQEYGFEAFGVDLRAAPVRELAGQGIAAVRGDITAAAQAAPFDVISMADVLEHTPFPKDQLHAAHTMLRDGGALFVSLPNAEAFLWNTLTEQNQNPYWAEMEHYHNFNRSRLFDLLDETGFAPKTYAISQRYRCGMEIIALKA